MTDNADTDVLLALLASMIKGPVPSQDILLGALADAEGSVEAAAARLNSRQTPKTASSKRKSMNGSKLDSWVVNKKRRDEGHARPTSRTTETGTSTKGTVSVPINVDDSTDDNRTSQLLEAEGSPSGKKARFPTPPTVSLMNILKQPPPPTKIPQKLQPRTLGTPDLVAQNSPCTLHPSILPPELACRLFYAMLREATSWEKNKWSM